MREMFHCETRKCLLHMENMTFFHDWQVQYISTKVDYGNELGEKDGTIYGRGNGLACGATVTPYF